MSVAERWLKSNATNFDRSKFTEDPIEAEILTIDSIQALLNPKAKGRES